MKPKTLLLILLCAVILALFIWGPPLFSQLIYHRSWNATLMVWQFDKNAYTDEQAFEEYLDEKSEENALEYELPEDVELKTEYDVYLPAGPEGIPCYILNGTPPVDGQIIWYFTGGSYIDQPTGSHWRFLDSLAADTGATIVVPLYPKLPDADADTAYAMLTEAYNAYMLGKRWGDLVFMGDSAGGGMALSFAMQLRDAGYSAPDRLILLSPWADVTMSNPGIADYAKRDSLLDASMLAHLGALWAGGRSPADPVVSPLYGDLSALGRVCVFAAEGEILYPDLVKLTEALTAAGTAAELYSEPYMFHAWPLYEYMSIPESEESYERIVGLLTSEP